MTVYDLLKGNDLRSIGKSNEVVKLVGDNQELFDEIFAGIFHDDPVIRARCADAAEKVSQKKPSMLKPHKKTILKNLDKFSQKEVNWHIALMLGYLSFTKSEKEKVVDHLFRWMAEKGSIIVRVCCMQTLSKLASIDSNLKKVLISEIKKMMITGSPAIKARGRILLKEMKNYKC